MTGAPRQKAERENEARSGKPGARSGKKETEERDTIRAESVYGQRCGLAVCVIERRANTVNLENPDPCHCSHVAQRSKLRHCKMRMKAGTNIGTVDLTELVRLARVCTPARSRNIMHHGVERNEFKGAEVLSSASSGLRLAVPAIRPITTQADRSDHLLSQTPCLVSLELELVRSLRVLSLPMPVDAPAYARTTEVAAAATIYVGLTSAAPRHSTYMGHLLNTNS